MASLSKENINFVKFCFVSADLFPVVLRHILQCDIPPSQIWIEVQAALNHGLKLSNDQKNKVKNAAKTGYNDIDVTLCYTIIRHLSLPSVTVPSHGWGKLPSCSSQTTVGDDVERIRALRNKCGHASSTGIPELDFRGYWNIIQDICSRMDEKYGGTLFTDKLKGIEIIEDEIDIFNRKQITKNATAGVGRFYRYIVNFINASSSFLCSTRGQLPINVQ